MGDYVGEVTVPSPVTALCIGSGRFLRSVLVPALNASGLKTAIFQTRGRTFMDYCERQRCGEGGDSEESVGLSYEVDTVEFDGTVRSDTIAFYGAGSLGFEGGKVAALSLVDRMERCVRR